MVRQELDVEATRSMLLAVAEGMIASTGYLSDLDRAIGDGDHGIGMQHGFEAVRDALGANCESVAKVFQTVGTTLMTSIGGASGAIFGTLFRGGGAKLAGEKSFTSRALALFLAEGLTAVQARGKAKVGAKTMVDALEPAARRAAECEAAPLGEAIVEAAEAARLGMERTKDMLASTGKAKTLGARALGHIDPGAASMHLVLKSMADFVARPEGGR